jgi:hypothetical protein
MASDFRIEHVQAKPQGWRARTILTHTGHEIRLGFPPGRRRKGSGRLLEILHPKSENPSCEVTPQRAAEVAAEHLGELNPSELLILGVNPAEQNPSELLILGAATNPDRSKQKDTRDRAQRIRDARLNPNREKQKETRDRAERIRGARLNPEPGETQEDKAADLYRDFAGKEPTQLVEIQRSDRMRKDYTGLADLDALVLADGFDLAEYERFRADMKRENGDFGRVRKPANCGLIYFERRDAVKVASNPDGTQLYLLGGNQDLAGCLHELGVDASKDLIDLGFCICIRYITEKSQNNFARAMYWHCLGEETKNPPRMFYDKLKREIFFTGGAYVVRAPGIIN